MPGLRISGHFKFQVAFKAKVDKGYLKPYSCNLIAACC